MICADEKELTFGFVAWQPLCYDVSMSVHLCLERLNENKFALFQLFHVHRDKDLNSNLKSLDSSISSLTYSALRSCDTRTPVSTPNSLKTPLNQQKGWFDFTREGPLIPGNQIPIINDRVLRRLAS